MYEGVEHKEVRRPERSEGSNPPVLRFTQDDGLIAKLYLINIIFVHKSALGINHSIKSKSAEEQK